MPNSSSEKTRVQCRAMRTKGMHELRKRMRALKRNIPLAERQDKDGIHDLRVASRRMRVALKELRRAFPKTAYHIVYDVVREITRGLGKARELDVCTTQLAEKRSDWSGSIRLAANYTYRYMRLLRRHAARSVEDVCALPKTHHFQRAFKQLLHDAVPAKRCLIQQAVRNITRKHERLVSAYKRSSGDENELHAIRIELKKLRYACEVYAELFGKPLQKYIRSLKSLQESLGRWNDARVLRDYVVECRKRYNRNPSLDQGFEQLQHHLEQELVQLQQRVEKTAARILHIDAAFPTEILDHPKKHCSECPWHKSV